MAHDSKEPKDALRLFVTTLLACLGLAGVLFGIVPSALHLLVLL